MKRLATMLCLLCVILMMVPLSVGATPRTHNLLFEQATSVSSGDGTVSYTPSGAMVVESTSEEGVTVAIVLNEFVDIRNLRYLQTSLESSCSFNIGLMFSGGIYAQMIDPSWYEAFQDTPPADGEGIAGGVYTLSQDVVYFTEYNGLALPEDGLVTIKTVFVTLGDVGKLTLEHLTLSMSSSFVTISNHVGELAPHVPPLTDYAIDFYDQNVQSPTLNLTAATVSGVQEAPSADSVVMLIVIVLMITLVVTVLAVATVKKRVPKQWNMDLFDDDSSSDE